MYPGITMEEIQTMWYHWGKREGGWTVVPQLAVGICFKTPHSYEDLRVLKSFVLNGTVFTYNLNATSMYLRSYL